MVEWYHLAPVILDDALFFSLTPPMTESGTVGQRLAAYATAERQAMNAIGTFLLPTTVTGTWPWPQPYAPLVLPHNRVHSIDRVAVNALQDCNCDLTQYDGCGIIRSGYGYIDVRVVASRFISNCGCGSLVPYNMEVTYTAGLPTGTAAQDSSLHLALAIAARLTLWEMIEPGALEGGAGDPGVQSYGTLGYSEQRVKLKVTPFGASALANKAWLLTEHLRLKRAFRFR